MTTNRLRRALACAALLVTLAGCSIALDAGTLGIKASMAEPAGTQVEGTEFAVTERAVFMLWGILPVSRPSLEHALSGQLLDGTEVANLRVNIRSRWSDILISALTVGLIVPRSVTYEGVIVGPGS